MESTHSPRKNLQDWGWLKGRLMLVHSLRSVLVCLMFCYINFGSLDVLEIFIIYQL